MNHVARFMMAAIVGLLIGALLRPNAGDPNDITPIDDWSYWQLPSVPNSDLQLAESYRQRPFWGTGPAPTPEPVSEELTPPEQNSPVPGTLLSWSFMGTGRSAGQDTAWLILQKPEGQQVVTVRPGDRLQDNSLITAVESARIYYNAGSDDSETPTLHRHLYEDPK